MDTPVNNPPLENANPSLYTAIQLSYKGRQIQLNAHDLMSYWMQHYDMLLNPETQIDTLPTHSTTPLDWLSLNPALKNISLGGHTISIDDATYTSLQSFPHLL